ncbi:hypothetical protein [Arenivirga flava]|uniref:hypothetical protein n=1 Tax=Arenivirga flava TaxID=1930060 RepID=UPI0024E0527B|nr:hypothetical protein [Arenivirga flava]
MATQITEETEAETTLEATLSGGEAIEAVVYAGPPLAPPVAPTQAEIDAARDARLEAPPEYLTTGESDREEGVLEAAAVDDADFAPFFAEAVTSTSAAFAWVDSDEATAYEVVRDGEPIWEGTATEFLDEGLIAGTDFLYEVTSFDAQGKSIITRTIPITTLGERGENQTSMSPMTYQPYGTAYLYRTFIPDNRVSMDLATTWGCGQAFKPNRSFSGDDRSWATPPASTPFDLTTYRSSVFLYANWDSPDGMSYVKDVSPTKLYEGNSLIETRTASVNGISVTNLQMSGSFAGARINHEVTNPFCAAGAISYSVDVRMYRNGLIETVGWRYPVPRHEIYGRWNNTGAEFWRTIGQLSNQGFHCLTGACGSETVNLSKTY